MTDPRPIFPIPPDARVGDIIVGRDGERREIESPPDRDEGPSVNGWDPAGYNLDGSSWNKANHHFDCIAFEYADGRKPNLPHTGKPKRTQAQRDAAYIRYVLREVEKREVMGLVIHISQQKIKRMLAIADRMEGKT